jgi:hypothetical protein
MSMGWKARPVEELAAESDGPSESGGETAGEAAEPANPNEVPAATSEAAVVASEPTDPGLELAPGPKNKAAAPTPTTTRMATAAANLRPRGRRDRGDAIIG